MNIAAFVISLFAGVISFLQSGCVGSLGTAISEAGDKSFDRIVGASFLVIIAAIIGITGGSMALARKKASRIVLFVAAVLCLVAFFMSGLKYAASILWGVCYLIAFFFAIFACKKQTVSPVSTAPQNPVPEYTAQQVVLAIPSIAALNQTAYTQNLPQPSGQAPTQLASQQQQNATLSQRVKYAFSLLQHSDFKEAENEFDVVLALNPKYSGAYLGKLMAKRQAQNSQELVCSSEPLEKDPIFINAFNSANPKMKQVLKKYVQVNRIRIKLSQS